MGKTDSDVEKIQIETTKETKAKQWEKKYTLWVRMCSPVAPSVVSPYIVNKVVNKVLYVVNKVQSENAKRAQRNNGTCCK